MPTRNSPSASPLKILFAVLLVCLFVASLLITLAVYWISSVFTHGRRATTELPGNRQRARPVLASTGPVTAFAAPAQYTPNAILAFRTNQAALPGDDIFKEAFIPRIKLVIPSQGVSALNRSPRTYTRITVEEGEKTYTNVAIRLKGGPGSYRAFNDIPSFTVNFDKFAPGQTFHGLKKIHLNSSVQDNSYLEERICRELFEAVDVPVPRAGNAVVTINNRDARMYVLVEGINKQFLKRYFKDASGNVFDGHSGSDVTMRLPTNSGDKPPDFSGLHRLAAAVQEPVQGGARLAALEKTLDLDRFLSFMAMEVIVHHWDGYTMARNNWRIFHDRDAQRMVFIPQGVDQMFNHLSAPVMPDRLNGMVARAVLDVPELQERYVDRFAQILTSVFRPDQIGHRIDEVSAKIEAALAEIESESAAKAQEQRAASLRRKVARRAEFLENELFPAPPAEFDASGTLALKDWEPKIDLGDASFAREKDDAGKYLLRITTTNGCTASWRTTRVLPKGTYRLEARIRTQGVVLNPADQRAGAGLRVSRFRTGQKNEGDKEWIDIFFDFPVAEDQKNVELVCELRADKGTIWYQLDSLHLKRL